MNNEEIRNKVNDIYEKSKNLTEELLSLRENCSHDSHRIGYYSYRIGSMDVVKLCNHCDEVVGQPSAEEVEEFNSELGQTGSQFKTDKE